MNNTTAVSASIETMNNILSPLTPLGRHLLASVGLLVGFFALFVGKKFMRTTLLLIGFSIGFCLSALICHQIAEPNVLLVVSVVVGGLLGFLAACVGGVAKAAVSGSAGVLLTLVFVRSGLFSPLDPSEDYIVWLLLVTFILCVLWLTTKIFDVVLVLVTAIGGALMIVISIVHFIPTFQFNAVVMLSIPTSMPLCESLECISMFVLWGVLSLLGMFCQWRLWESDDDGDADGEEKSDTMESGRGKETEMVRSKRGRLSTKSREARRSRRESLKKKISERRRSSSSSSSARKYSRLSRSSTTDVV